MYQLEFNPKLIYSVSSIEPTIPFSGQNFPRKTFSHGPDLLPVYSNIYGSCRLTLLFFLAIKRPCRLTQNGTQTVNAIHAQGGTGSPSLIRIRIVPMTIATRTDPLRSSCLIPITFFLELNP